MATTKNIQSVERAFSILELFQKPGNPEHSLKEIAQALELNKSTTFGLVNTLTGLGYLRQNPDNQKYSLGLRLLLFANTTKVQNAAIRAMHPHLERLNRKYGETIHCAVRHGDGVVYVDKLESTGSVYINTQIGTVNDLHCTGVGKCILAYMPEADRERVLHSPLRALTSHTITDPTRLRAQIEQVRRRGYAEDHEEIAVGLSCLAVPVFSAPETSAYAISVSGVSSQLKIDRENGLLHDLLETSAEISRELFDYQSGERRHSEK